ncbi:hypothetical protein GCM10009794_21650 [Rothia terrae]
MGGAQLLPLGGLKTPITNCPFYQKIFLVTNPEPLEGQELKDFEKELEAILALDPIERLSRLDQTAEDLREDLR